MEKIADYTNDEEIRSIVGKFVVGNPIRITKLDTGNINRTLRVACDDYDRSTYILQRVNPAVFTTPITVIRNSQGVTRHLRQKALMNGENPEKATLHFIDTLNYDDNGYVSDDKNGLWRMTDFFKGAKTYNTIQEAYTEDGIDPITFAEEVGATYGKFASLLADYEGKLEPVIKDFHNTIQRFCDLRVSHNIANYCAGSGNQIDVIYSFIKAGREKDGQEFINKSITEEEIEMSKKRFNDDRVQGAYSYLMAHELEAGRLEGLKQDGLVPLRVTHNDTQINNVIFEEGKGVCVIDLDTVQYDTIFPDFGDMIRSSCNPAGEEPKDMSTVGINLDYFAGMTRGYLREFGHMLTEEEKDNLYRAPRVLALELASRFLADYMTGDKYFSVKEGQDPDVNLHRALVQIELAKDMKSKEEDMKQIVGECLTKPVVLAKK